jgi:hypothetical protein
MASRFDGDGGRISQPAAAVESDELTDSRASRFRSAHGRTQEPSTGGSSARFPRRTVRRSIETYRTIFKQDGKRADVAFDALRLIAAVGWGKPEEKRPGEDNWIPVPWWALEVIAVGWSRYLDGLEQKKPATLDSAFNLSAAKKGARPRMKRMQTEHYDRNLALEVHHALEVSRAAGTPITVAYAVESVARRFSASIDKVRDARRRFGKVAAERYGYHK